MPGKYVSGWVAGCVGGWLAGLAENITNSAQLKLEFGLSLAIIYRHSNFSENLSNARKRTKFTSGNLDGKF